MFFKSMSGSRASPRPFFLKSYVSVYLIKIKLNLKEGLCGVQHFDILMKNEKELNTKRKPGPRDLRHRIKKSQTKKKRTCFPNSTWGNS
jgi:hypothetical protein